MSSSNPNVQRVCNCALHPPESRYADSDAHRYHARTLGPKAVNVNVRDAVCESSADAAARVGRTFEVADTAIGMADKF